jgi:hypothetical protein
MKLEDEGKGLRIRANYFSSAQKSSAPPIVLLVTIARMFDQSECIRMDQEVSCIKKPPGLPVRFKLSL